MTDQCDRESPCIAVSLFKQGMEVRVNTVEDTVKGLELAVAGYNTTLARWKMLACIVLGGVMVIAGPPVWGLAVKLLGLL